MKRFFARLSIIAHKVYRMILHRPFIWRLRIEKPRIIIFGCDTMVMDNGSAEKREGCELIYKKEGLSAIAQLPGSLPDRCEFPIKIT